MKIGENGRILVLRKTEDDSNPITSYAFDEDKSEYLTETDEVPLLDCTSNTIKEFFEGKRALA